MKNLKIAQKLAVGFGVILLLFLISIVFASLNLRSIANNLDRFYKQPFANVALAIQADMNSEMAAKNMLQACLEQDTTETAHLLNQAATCLETMKEELTTLKANYGGDVNEIVAVETYMNQLNQSFANLDAAARSNNVTAAYRVYTSEIVSQLTNITDAIAVVRTTATNNATNSHDSGMASSQVTVLVMLVVGVAALLVGIALALYITKRITSAVVELQDASHKMSRGDFAPSLTYQSSDELGQLSASMRETMGNLRTIVHDMSDTLGQLANGNLTARSQVANSYVGELQPILTATHKLIEDLNHTMSGIATASDQVSAGAGQVSSGAQSLAQGATEQASAVQELAATINDISHQVSATAEHADIAKTRNLQAHEEIQVCSRHMNDLVGAMRTIEEKSSEVGKVIKVIEDIAFQTNILALNAAVEAARAGSAGKGFAVVADEVRNLASKSAEAAKNTTSLIGEAIQAVSEGTKLSGETEESLTKVVTESQAVLDAVINIAAAANQQTESIQQITQGVDQISSVVQTNSATAEESAAASEELSGQAHMLKDLISVFTLQEPLR